MAWSAASIICSGVAPTASGTRPALPPTASRTSPWATLTASISFSSSRALAAASGGPRFHNSTPNSSPPSRATTSEARTWPTSSRATAVVARLGGDEFGVLLWNLGAPLAAAKARELEKLIEAVSVAHGEARLAVGGSAGLVPLVVGATPEQMIDAADQAMYARKKERRS